MDSKTRHTAEAKAHQRAARGHSLARNARIYLAAEAGASTREIARELGLTHGYVARIIRNSKQEEES